MLPALNKLWLEEVVDAEEHLNASYPSKLRRSFEAMLRSCRSLVFLGPDDEVESLLLDSGLDERHYCAFSVASRGTRSCLVCIPTRIWSHPDFMEAFLQVKQVAASHGKTMLLLPESFVMDKLQGVGPGTQHLPHGVSTADRLIVLEHLMQKGCSTLSAVASLLHHPTPVDAVLQLVVSGILDIDLNAPILPASGVSLAMAR